MANLSLRKLRETDFEYFRQAWDWMQERPDLYGENEGFANYYEFVSPPPELQYYGLFADGQLIGVAALRLEGKRSCRAGLIVPKRPRFRAIASLLSELQRQFFQDFNGEALWICVPSKTHTIAQRFAQWFGWKSTQPGVFTFTLFDFLSQNHVYQENAASRATSH